MSSKSDRDNRSNQLNPNNGAYWSSRGHSSEDSSSDDDSGWPVSRSIADYLPAPRINRDPYIETVGFCVVSLDGRALYRCLSLEVPSSANDPGNARNQIADFLDDFSYRIRDRMAEAIRPEALALFAVFDPTRHRTPWHVPLHPDSLEATRAAISIDRLAHLSPRLKPLPPRPNEAFHQGLSLSDRPSRALSNWEKLASQALDPAPFLAALSAAVDLEAPCWGIFEVPYNGRMSMDEERRARIKLASLELSQP
jgi:hypothetical protein